MGRFRRVGLHGRRIMEQRRPDARASGRSSQIAARLDRCAGRHAPTAGVVLPPYTKTFGRVVRIRGPQFRYSKPSAENRRRTGFDRTLPGEGLLVWRVDTALEMNRPDTPAMALVQADGRHDLDLDLTIRTTVMPAIPFRGRRGSTSRSATPGTFLNPFPGPSVNLVVQHQRRQPDRRNQPRHQDWVRSGVLGASEPHGQ